MYGRADIDLLKLRMFHHSTKNQGRKARKKQRGQPAAHLKQPKSLKNSASSLHATPAISQVA